MAEEKANKTPIYKKWWFWAIAIMIVVVTALVVSVAASPKKSEPQKVVNDNPYTSAIDAADHPKLYDNGSDADMFASQHDDVVSRYEKFESGKTVMSLRSYGSTADPKNKILHEIELYPQEELNLEEAMSLAKDYLPMEIIKERYQQEWSEAYCEDSNGDRMYAQLYTPTPDGAKWIKENELKYNYALIFVAMKKDGYAKNIVLRSTNTLPNTGRNCHTDSWDYTILN